MVSDYSQQLRANDIDECPALTSYHSLDLAHQEIRLIRLTENLEIRKFALKAAPRYHAISYCWGQPWPKLPLRIGDELVEVRKSVVEIFEVLRARYGCEEWYWMDIFCINQHDLVERNSQVSLMAEIYSHAAGVLSWIGPSTPQSHDAFRFVEMAISCPQSAPPRLLNDEDTEPAGQGLVGEKWPSAEDLEADHKLYLQFAEATVWPAFDDIMSRPYWSRMWVVQEMIVAKQTYVLCGLDCCDLDDFVRIAGPWVQKSQTLQVDPKTSKLEIVTQVKSQETINTWMPLVTVVRCREQYKKNEILLMEVVDAFAVKHCANIRDKVYALRALSAEAATITVDYSRSVPEIFLSLVQSGLLLSDGGRGFQSLPRLARNMGVDRHKLGEILHGLDEVLIPIDAILKGKVVGHSKKSETMRKEYVGISVISTFAHNQVQTVYASETIENATNFLSHTQAGDVLVVVPTETPILLLLRPHEHRDPVVFDAIANVNHWATRISDEVLGRFPIAGEIIVEDSGSSNRAQKQRLMISSRSLSGLFIRTATGETQYSLQPVDDQWSNS